MVKWFIINTNTNGNHSIKLWVRPFEEQGQGLCFSQWDFGLPLRVCAAGGPSTAAPRPGPAGGRPLRSARWPGPRS